MTQNVSLKELSDDAAIIHITITFQMLMTLQFSPGRHPRVWLTCMQLPAVYLLWCQCTAELHLLNDMYTRQWHINW